MRFLLLIVGFSMALGSAKASAADSMSLSCFGTNEASKDVVMSAMPAVNVHRQAIRLSLPFDFVLAKFAKWSEKDTPKNVVYVKDLNVYLSRGQGPTDVVLLGEETVKRDPLKVMMLPHLAVLPNQFIYSSTEQSYREPGTITFTLGGGTVRCRYKHL